MFRALIEIFQGKWPPVRVALRKHGVLKVTIGITLLSVILSVLITIAVMLLTDGRLSMTGLLISIFIPAVLAPSFEYRLLSVLLQLDLAEEKLRITTTKDELTHAYNRRHFFELANQELARTQRYGGTFSIAILDFDNFKSVNDLYGHQVGDQALMELSKICNTNIRLPDVFARYGGDEFVFLFPQSNKEKAGECLKRILNSISNNPLLHENSHIQIRVSIGLAEFSRDAHQIDHILREADIALYRAKHEGGNRIV
jgi:diguanylate cyclase (GGDEF)-like protein